jgi:hypothetical protein
MLEMIQLLDSYGFTLVALKPLSHNLESGDIAQADGTFIRHLT